MDINDNQQTNTFVKGMNTDVSDALMDSSQYRYAENIRLVTNKDENTGEIRLIEGNKAYADLSNCGTIIAMTSVRHLLVVITLSGIKNYILVKDTKEDTNWRMVYYSNTEQDQLGEHISLVTRWESDNNVKLYIADGVHPLMYINLMAKDGEDYVVKSGVGSISNMVEGFLKQPTTSILNSGGHLNAPKIQYAYRLYKMGGATTNISPLSNLVVLYESANKGYANQTDGVYKIDKLIQITIPENQTDCEYLQIFRIGYISGDGQPDIQMIYDDTYISSYTDTGYNIESVDYAEFLSYIKFNTVPRIIESKNDYLFSANIHDTKTKIDSMYEDADVSDCITIDESCIETEYVYINDKNEKYRGSGYDQIVDQVRSLKPGEVYRYGVILYDSTGNYTSAKWLADIEIIGDYSISKLGDYYQFKKIGIRPIIQWATLLSKYPQCVAVEIVRCIRTISDRKTITQGIAGYPLLIYDKKESESSITEVGAICSPGLLSINRFAIAGHMRFNEGFSGDTQQQFGLSDNNYLLFASPEYVYLKDDVLNALTQNNIYITHDGLADVSTKTTKFPTIDVLDLGIKRIESYQDTYDYGVPYSVYKAPTDKNELYTWLKDYYISSDNNAPTYKDHVDNSGITTFIHNAWIASHYAQMMWDNKNTSGFKPYINGAAEGVPKVYMSASYYNVQYNTPTQREIVGKVGYATVPDYNSLYNDTLFVGSDSISLGPQQYVNWTIPVAYLNDTNAHGARTDDGYIQIERMSNNYYWKFLGNMGLLTYPIGSTGECIILKQDQPTDFYNGGDKIKASIISIKQNIQPYGGELTKKMSTYTSFGNIILANNSPEVIYDGDCFPGVFVYNACHTSYEPLGGYITLANVQIVPVYSDIDLSATFGDLFPNITKSDKYWLLDIAGQIHTFKLDYDAYMYNTAYGLDPTAMSYNTIKYTTIDTDSFDTRVFFSNPKTNNEHIDSWLKTNELDYKDVDSRFGQITNMRLFKDKLIFWQEHATGILSVNERTMLNDTSGNEIIVGTGDVLSRYDYISTVYGMKEYQYEAEVLSNTTQYWWDDYNKEILAYAGGMELVPLTKTKNITNYINQRNKSERPMLMHDVKYDEIIALVVGGESIVYSERMQTFQSVYKFIPLYKANIGNILYTSDNTCIYIQNELDLETQAILFNKPIFPKVRIVVNKNNTYTKTFDNVTFGGKMYKGSLLTIANWPMLNTSGFYVTGEHLNSPMHHLEFTFETPLKQKSIVRGDKAVSVDEYDYRLAIPRNGSLNSNIEYGNRMRGKTMQCEIASDYNSTDFSLQYITTKFRMSWS